MKCAQIADVASAHCCYLATTGAWRSDPRLCLLTTTRFLQAPNMFSSFSGHLREPQWFKPTRLVEEASQSKFKSILPPYKSVSRMSDREISSLVAEASRSKFKSIMPDRPLALMCDEEIDRYSQVLFPSGVKEIEPTPVVEASKPGK